MKKFFLFICILGAVGLFAQTIDKSKFSSPGELPKQSQEPQSTIKSKITQVSPKLRISTDNKGKGIVNPVPIGQSGNAWGFAYMRTTYLWAENDINSVSFIHRMMPTPGTGFLAYDISTDGGTTWSNNNQAYDPTLYEANNARYPQGAIYNPDGNTDPNEAYFSYFAPTLDESNPSSGGGTWGGYTWGSSKLASGSVPTQTNLPSEDDFYQYLPSGYTITQLGDAWIVDEEQTGASGDYIYTDNLIVGHGIWNDGTEDFDYSFEHLPLEINPENSINDVKVAFAPDGMTGWICALTDRIPALDQTWYHPVLFKTTDGGETWSDPIEVQLGGDDGLDGVKEFITDERLAEFYDPEPAPARDEIPYFMGYHMDMAVDAWGNPHIFGVVALCDLGEQSWYNSEGIFAMMHIYTDNQGETWEAFAIDKPVTHDMEFAGGGSTMKQYNRAQVATTKDGAIVFFSFLDTRMDGVTDNSNPDIYFREYFPETKMHGEEVVNVTIYSNAMWVAYWGCMSHYVFADVSAGGNYECTIPFVYEELNNLDISQPVQFYYIPDFKKSYVITRVDDNVLEPNFTVSKSYPSPFRNETNLNINLLEKSNIKVSVYSTTGQLVKTIDFGTLCNGPHQITLNLSDLTSGIYFYSISNGSSSIAGKLIKE